MLMAVGYGSGGVNQKIKNLPIPSGRFIKVLAVESLPTKKIFTLVSSRFLEKFHFAVPYQESKALLAASII